MVVKESKRDGEATEKGRERQEGGGAREWRKKKRRKTDEEVKTKEVTPHRLLHSSLPSPGRAEDSTPRSAEPEDPTPKE